MASTLKGLWITHDKPMQAKTLIRIEAHNANADLNNLLSQRIDLTSSSPAENVKLNASKIYSDSGSMALFTPDGDIEEAVKVKGNANTLKNVLTLGNDKAKSQCQLYIDSDVCLGANCRFSVTRVMFQMNDISGELINPFSEDQRNSLQIGSDIFRERDLSDIFSAITVSTSDKNRFMYHFCKNVSALISVDNTFVSNVAEGFPVGAKTYFFAYIYADSKEDVIIKNENVFVPITSDFRNVCVHIAGVAGACAGKKVDTGLPPSNIFKTTTIPDLLFNCDPFDCMPDYVEGIGTLPACVVGCPYGAIKHKQTLTTALPTDNDNQIKTLSALKMTRFPFSE